MLLSVLISIICYVRKCLYLFYRYFWPVIYVYLYSYIYRVFLFSPRNDFKISYVKKNILSAYQVFSKQILKWHVIILHAHTRFRHDSMAALLLFSWHIKRLHYPFLEAVVSASKNQVKKYISYHYFSSFGPIR